MSRNGLRIFQIPKKPIRFLFADATAQHMWSSRLLQPIGLHPMQGRALSQLFVCCNGPGAMLLPTNFKFQWFRVVSWPRGVPNDRDQGSMPSSCRSISHQFYFTSTETRVQYQAAAGLFYINFLQLTANQSQKIGVLKIVIASDSLPSTLGKTPFA